MTEEIQYGNRINRESKFYELYQKSVELGTWNVEELIRQSPVEKDTETWASLTEAEKEAWARQLVALIDAEHQVQKDAEGLMAIAGSPYLDDNVAKQFFVSGLALEESKHTQFFTWYSSEVMGDYVETVGTSPFHGEGVLLPRALATGIGDIYEEIDRRVAEATGPDHTPRDIARAATVYHMTLEGIAARFVFHIRNRMMQRDELPTLSRGMQFVSTDEGRHITAGAEILNELLAKEREGHPEYQGVGEAIFEQIKHDTPHLVDAAVFLIEQHGNPYGIDYDDVLDRVDELYEQQYEKLLDLGEHYNSDLIGDIVDEHEEKKFAKIENGVYERDLKEARERFWEANRRAAADGGRR